MREQTILDTRAAGVLLPVSSLPSDYGIGGFGEEAYRWVDFLNRAGHKYWQVLPLGPTSYGDSPYQSFSAFSGNPYFIDLDLLCKQGMLKKEEYSSVFWGRDKTKISYDILFRNRETVLRKAFKRFTDNKKMCEFRNANAAWIEDYALYMSIKASKNHRPWIEWEEAIRLREEKTMKYYKEKFEQDIDFHVFLQHIFFEQWHSLRAYAAKKGIGIIGDIPIYVSLDSSDVWANSHMFQLDANGFPTEVAGVPPDFFSADGQLWGNPLYNWEALKADNYTWWKNRISASFDIYDILRIDHFRGLESYYAIPAGHTTARKGKWRKGPGIDFINAIKSVKPEAEIIAEDLGFLTEEVRQLLKDSGYPGMKILQFAFDTREAGDYSPYGYPNASVVFTGTHDNDTVLGWVETAPKESVKHAMEYMNVRRKKDVSMAFIRTAMQTGSCLAVVPMQDWLNLKSNARVNTPSTLGGNNWRWRMKKIDINDKLARKMEKIVSLYGRKNIVKQKKQSNK